MTTSLADAVAELRARTKDAAVWFDPTTRAWWMDDRDPIVARARVMAAPLAIAVTNAYESWDLAGLERMAREAHWLETEASGLAESDDRQGARPLAPPEKGHTHRFDELYDPRIDRWFCRCGASMDRFAGLWNADGSRQQMTVECTTGTKDLGVRSGRERLTC